MKAVIQKVSRAGVSVEGSEISRIEKGLLILLGVAKNDTEKEIAILAEKILNLRIFEDEGGKFNFSLLDIGGELLVVSQFTLFADCSKGRRPSFTDAAAPEMADELYTKFIQYCTEKGVNTQKGQFRAMMEVELVNSGPVTIVMDTDRF